MPTVSGIRIYPIKAFDPIDVDEAEVLASGALELDRRWAFVDRQGRFVNGKNRAEVHTIRAEYNLAQREVAFEGRVCSLDRQRSQAEA